MQPLDLPPARQMTFLQALAISEGRAPALPFLLTGISPLPEPPAETVEKDTGDGQADAAW